MWMLSLVPFFLQALVICLDEGVFHVKRGLPKWERIGHPLDTLSVLVCLALVLWLPFSMRNLVLYSIAAAFSSFLVTKDEFVHKEFCPASEQWLHAVLFTLHPITLLCLGFFWPLSQGLKGVEGLSFLFALPFDIRFFLKGQMFFMTLFFLYQIIFWNIVWKDKPVIKL